MKKALFTLIALLILSSACVQPTPAPGETATAAQSPAAEPSPVVQETESLPEPTEEPLHVSPVLMIMFDDTLFTEAGVNVTHRISCGTPDGYVQSSTDGSQPTQNGQTNFGAVGAKIMRLPEGVAVETGDQYYLYTAYKTDATGMTICD